MDIDKLFTAMTNYAKCREQLVKMPASQKKEVQPNYDAAKVKLTAIINETIDERLTDHVKSGRVLDTPPILETDEQIDDTPTEKITKPITKDTETDPMSLL